MTSYVTPKKNTAYIVYVALEDQANTGLFKSSPTLAAGDFKVSIDGGALTNLATLPTNTPAGSAMVKISLSAAEMNGDNITVVCTDAAGAEWYDLVLNIQTSARQIDDLAYPATSGRSLAVAATGEVTANVTYHAGMPVAAADLNGNLPVNVKLWKDSAPSNLMSGEVPAKLSSSSGQIIADATKLLPGAGLPAIGSVAYILPTLPTDADVQAAAAAALEAYDPPTMAEMDAAAALIMQRVSGSGAITFTYTLTSSVGGAPIADADVWVTSDMGGSNVLASGRTDQNGVVTFYLDAGTVYVWRQKSSWNFDNPDTEVVS